MLLSRAIPQRTDAELATMRRAGLVVAEMHVCIRAAIKPGVTTADLDQVGREVIARRGATSNFLHYYGYPAVICTSPNDVIVHGIPSDSVVLHEGDLISVDCGAIVDGWHGDAAFSAPVGSAAPETLKLIEVAERSLDAAIAADVVDGNRLGDIGAAVQRVVEAEGFSVVRGYTGHGIGTAMHEDPSVPNHGRPGSGIKLRRGNVLAIEPMVNAGGADTAELDDGWSVVTADGSWSAHVEHTVAITGISTAPRVLTRP